MPVCSSDTQWCVFSFVEQAEQVIEEDNMLEALDVIELHCKILIEQAAQLEKPKYVQSLPVIVALGFSF